MKKNRSFIALLLLGIFVFSVVGYWLLPFIADKSSSVSSENRNNHAPTFTKEGEVTFWRAQQKIVTIDVEIAATESERAQGLMFRPSMPDSVGMLFIFEWSAPQAFWMKNTIMSLDIIYVDENKKIVSISKNAVPYSEESLPSAGNAQYVVEVVAGFTDKYGIQPGDRITF
jgi:uncharacterized membrane protein (UPF0127 family)